MAISNGYIDATARRKAAKFRHGLLVQYDDHERFIEDRSIIAVISRRKSEQGKGDDDKTARLMFLRTKGSSAEECYFESIG